MRKVSACNLFQTPLLTNHSHQDGNDTDVEFLESRQCSEVRGLQQRTADSGLGNPSRRPVSFSMRK